MEGLVRVALALLFVGCLADMPYGYFRAVRLLGTVGFIYLAFREKERSNGEMFWFWVSSAVLINPIVKISLGRALWNAVDILWAVVLVWPLLNRRQ
ncbi:MAG: hypothetical protein RMJ33_01645 [Saprospiraceae bacterium]|nr:hypothetical protein [Saprospiraceae bacterium]MDW8228515.1 hypothetical protein [Saprospiraceae bacterium]